MCYSNIISTYDFIIWNYTSAASKNDLNFRHSFFNWDSRWSNISLFWITDLAALRWSLVISSTISKCFSDPSVRASSAARKSLKFQKKEKKNCMNNCKISISNIHIWKTYMLVVPLSFDSPLLAEHTTTTLFVFIYVLMKQFSQCHF